eukprot:TRINITY_DN6432_c0_g1_i1.p1 TRINITY_DN6432_c0_g1~~TRINITY_DN6432_c0_g1_i1.p1  ORF type:complete len:241 (-),score=38.41 TRINITY_DN6432_c0_g1_i1:118-801(-)
MMCRQQFLDLNNTYNNNWRRHSPGADANLTALLLDPAATDPLLRHALTYMRRVLQKAQVAGELRGCETLQRDVVLLVGLSEHLWNVSASLQAAATRGRDRGRRGGGGLGRAIRGEEEREREEYDTEDSHTLPPCNGNAGATTHRGARGRKGEEGDGEEAATESECPLGEGNSRGCLKHIVVSLAAEAGNPSTAHAAAQRLASALAVLRLISARVVRRPAAAIVDRTS